MTMRPLALTAFALAVCLVAGCSSASKQLVGTWKGEILPPVAAKTPPPSNSSNPIEGFGKALEQGLQGFVNAVVGPMTVEFNADGKYKISLSLGSQTGTYSVSGNEVTLTPDKTDGKSKIDISKLVLSEDGKVLRTKKEFNSDSVFELKKQPDQPK